MYEPAAPAPLWRLDRTRTLYLGTLDHNDMHEHGAPVFLSSLDAPFGLRVGSGPWRSCEAAMIPAGALHELEIGGQPIAVLYAEPSAAGAGSLAALVEGADESDGALVGGSSVKRLMRSLYEDPSGASWAGEALDDVLKFGGAHGRRALDPRVALAASCLADDDHAPSLGAVARKAGLSTSRLQHLFTAEIGVPFRRYRAWARMRRAIAEIVSGANFTRAAHEAGFCDHAHFARDFRRTFGAPASRSLTGVRRQQGQDRRLGEP